MYKCVNAGAMAPRRLMASWGMTPLGHAVDDFAVDDFPELKAPPKFRRRPGQAWPSGEAKAGPWLPPRDRQWEVRGAETPVITGGAWGGSPLAHM